MLQDVGEVMLELLASSLWIGVEEETVLPLWPEKRDECIPSLIFPGSQYAFLFPPFPSIQLLSLDWIE
jgi:hypothetical protein